jgi:hypothetical protein
MIASESQTAKPSSSTSSGTRPVGASASRVVLNAELSAQSRRSGRSVNSMPKCVMTSHARSDHDE